MFALAGCAALSAAARPPGDATLDRDNQSRLATRIKVGSTLIVSTSPKPISAYRWTVERVMGNSLRLEDAGKYESVQPATPGGRTHMTFALTALAAGCDVYDFQFHAGARRAEVVPLDRFELEVCADSN